MGPARQIPLAKFSAWARDRQVLEQAKLQNVTEVLLSNDGDALLEGTVTNFFVVTMYAVDLWLLGFRTSLLNLKFYDFCLPHQYVDADTWFRVLSPPADALNVVPEATEGQERTSEQELGNQEEAPAVAGKEYQPSRSFWEQSK